MFYVDCDKSLHLTRGDTARITVDIFNDITNEKYEVKENDVVVLSVKKSVYDEEYCFQKKEKGNSSFKILPEDTNGLQFGKYIYDVQISTEQGDVYTVIQPSIFEVMKEVST